MGDIAITEEQSDYEEELNGRKSYYLRGALGRQKLKVKYRIEDVDLQEERNLVRSDSRK